MRDRIGNFLVDISDNEDDEKQSHKESENEQQKVNMRSRKNHDKLKAKSCPHGLRGGGGFNTHISSQYEYPHHLQLINSGSDCFVNSVIQLLRVIFLENEICTPSC